MSKEIDANTLRSQGGVGSLKATVEKLKAESEKMQAAEKQARQSPGIDDPGVIPERLLTMPGFVGAVVDHCLKTAPYPNRALAFTGAAALQAFLAGRKIRDTTGLRTNNYFLALAQSGCGKDHPRKLNRKICSQIGLSNCIGGDIGSGAGLEDALVDTPNMLFQTDEIDQILETVNGKKDGNIEGILRMILILYGSAGNDYACRKLAKGEPGKIIAQPCLSILGTAIPENFYSALSARLFTNGFMPRLVVFEAGPRGVAQIGREVDPCPNIMGVAQWWADYCPEGSTEFEPKPHTVPISEEASTLLFARRLEIDKRHYDPCNLTGDRAGCAIWARVAENAQKMALLYAVSENHQRPIVSVDAIRHSLELVELQARGMLFQAQGRVSENPFDADCMKLMRTLRKHGGQMLHSDVMTGTKFPKAQLARIIETLVDREDIDVAQISTKGMTGTHYRLKTKAI